MAVHVLFFISQNYSVQIFFLYPLFSPRPPNFLSTFLRTNRMMSACVASVFAAPDHHHLRTDAAQLIALPRPVLASQSFQTILIPPGGPLHSSNAHLATGLRHNRTASPLTTVNIRVMAVRTALALIMLAVAGAYGMSLRLYHEKHCAWSYVPAQW